MKKFQTPKITVAIRKRPLNKKETSKGQTDIIKIQNRQTLIISEYKQKVDLTKYIQETTFNFDYAFDQNCNNEEIYQASIRPLIDSAFEGAKISCFAYGQTGSGKTFTMKGDMSKGVPGLYYLAAKEIFGFIEHPQFQHLNILVSFYEIYCGKLYDLLSDRKQLKIREDKNANINIIGLEQKPIYSANEFLDIIEYGSTFRITSQNATNADSSRSHAIMQITIKDGKKAFSKVSFIDLAGNERGADHMDQNKQTKIDGAQINKSLLALKQCIRALDQGKGHTPFRGSKLTMVLKDSFVGFCKTVMIGNVSPNVSSSQNTLNTLRYADRVKQLKKPSENLTKQEQYAKELMLPRAANKNVIKVNIQRQDDMEDIQKKLQIAKKKQQNQVQKMQIQNPVREVPLNLEKRGSYKEVSSSKDIVMQGKKTESNAYRIQERKSPYNNTKQDGSLKDIMKNNENVNTSVEHANNGSKKTIPGGAVNGPLFQKNVIKMKIDQNNINTSNQEPVSSVNKNKPPLNVPRTVSANNSESLQNMPSEQLNRQHFDAMNSLHNEFSKFKDNHSKFVKEQTIIIRDQMMKLGQMSERQEFTSQAQSYLDFVQSSINEKLSLMEELKNQIEKLRKKQKDAQDIGKALETQKKYQKTEQETVRQRPNNMMEIEAPKPTSINLSSMGVNSNPVKYVYHSSMNQPERVSYNNSISQVQPMNNGYVQSHHTVQPSYQPGVNNTNNNSSSYNYGYVNTQQTTAPVTQGGYQFSQYYQKNSYVPSNNYTNNTTPVQPNNNNFGGYSQMHNYVNNNNTNNHSNNNYINYGNNNIHHLHNDQQLLEDLPGDQNMQRLF